MLKENYIEASKVKHPFQFTYTKPSLDWYEMCKQVKRCIRSKEGEANGK